MALPYQHRVKVSELLAGILKWGMFAASEPEIFADVIAVQFGIKSDTQI